MNLLRPNRFFQAFSILVWILAFILATWFVVVWIWYAALAGSHAAKLSSLTEPSAAASAIRQHHLLEITSARPDSPPREQYSLTGVMTDSASHRGFAILTEPDKPPRYVLEGETLSPGVSVEKILPTEIVLLRDGIRQNLPLSRGALSSVHQAAQPTSEPSGDHTARN
ncbi:MAG: hypothetical protein JSR19_10995 [Proteobacteria bacterium]|nr:hypothetical protein [Pseudomonadota bacterium]HQR02569.1 type II secretion system protein N [Rhodocyclaceae bacterium]